MLLSDSLRRLRPLSLTLRKPQSSSTICGLCPPFSETYEVGEIDDMLRRNGTMVHKEP